MKIFSWTKNNKKTIFSIFIIFVVLIKLLDLAVDKFLLPPLNLGTYKLIHIKEHFPKTYHFFNPNSHDNPSLASYLTLHVNNDGFITTTDKPHENITHADIIFFGGSTTLTLDAEEDKRFPALVGTYLSQKLEKEIITLNSGQSGTTSFHSFVSLVGKGLKYQPKIAVLMHGINDWYVLSRVGSYLSSYGVQHMVRKPKTPAHAFLKSIKDMWVQSLWLYAMKDRFWFHNITDWVFGYQNRENPKNIVPSAYEIPHVTKAFKSSLTSFITTAKAWGIEPVLMTQMHRIVDYGDPFITNFDDAKKAINYQKAMNDTTRQVAKEYDLFLIDLDRDISGKKEYVFDEVHLNTAGSIKVAEVIAHAIEKKYKNLLLAPARQ